MSRRSQVTDPDLIFGEALRAARSLSLGSLVWTIAAGVAAITIGLSSGTGALVAFGAVGFVDGLGSTTLLYHFDHGVRHEQISTRVENIAHRVVSLGLVIVGTSTVIINVTRLFLGSEGDASLSGAVLAAASLSVLSWLAARKVSVAGEVSSAALRSDGHLSAVGATLAAVTIFGMAATRWFGWPWADAGAACAVGVVAVLVGLATLNLPKPLVRTCASGGVITAGIALTCAVAGLDALLGSRVVLIGLLVIGPACTAISRRPGPTFAVSVLAVALAVALGIPDGVWASAQHHAFTGAVAFAGAVNTAVVVLIARRSCAPDGAIVLRMADGDARTGRE